jgi:hypothetical protein
MNTRFLNFLIKSYAEIVNKTFDKNKSDLQSFIYSLIYQYAFFDGETYQPESISLEQINNYAFTTRIKLFENYLEKNNFNFEEIREKLKEDKRKLLHCFYSPSTRANCHFEVQCKIYHIEALEAINQAYNRYNELNN